MVKDSLSHRIYQISIMADSIAEVTTTEISKDLTGENTLENTMNLVITKVVSMADSQIPTEDKGVIPTIHIIKDSHGNAKIVKSKQEQTDMMNPDIDTSSKETKGTVKSFPLDSSSFGEVTKSSRDSPKKKYIKQYLSDKLDQTFLGRTHLKDDQLPSQPWSAVSDPLGRGILGTVSLLPESVDLNLKCPTQKGRLASSPQDLTAIKERLQERIRPPSTDYVAEFTRFLSTRTQSEDEMDKGNNSKEKKHGSYKELTMALQVDTKEMMVQKCLSEAIGSVGKLPFKRSSSKPVHENVESPLTVTIKHKPPLAIPTQVQTDAVLVKNISELSSPKGLVSIIQPHMQNPVANVNVSAASEPLPLNQKGSDAVTRSHTGTKSREPIRGQNRIIVQNYPLVQKALEQDTCISSTSTEHLPSREKDTIGSRLDQLQKPRGTRRGRGIGQGRGRGRGRWRGRGGSHGISTGFSTFLNDGNNVVGKDVPSLELPTFKKRRPKRGKIMFLNGQSSGLQIERYPPSYEKSFPNGKVHDRNKNVRARNRGRGRGRGQGRGQSKTITGRKQIIEISPLDSDSVKYVENYSKLMNNLTEIKEVSGGLNRENATCQMVSTYTNISALEHPLQSPGQSGCTSNVLSEQSTLKGIMNRPPLTPKAKANRYRSNTISSLLAQRDKESLKNIGSNMPTGLISAAPQVITMQSNQLQNTSQTKIFSLDQVLIGGSNALAARPVDKESLPMIKSSMYDGKNSLARVLARPEPQFSLNSDRSSSFKNRNTTIVDNSEIQKRLQSSESGTTEVSKHHSREAIKNFLMLKSLTESKSKSLVSRKTDEACVIDLTKENNGQNLGSDSLRSKSQLQMQNPVILNETSYPEELENLGNEDDTIIEKDLSPICLPRHMYYPKSHEKNKKVSASDSAPTVVKLLNQKSVPLQAKPLHNPPPPNSVEVRINVRPHPSMPPVAHQKPARYTLRLTQLMTPPPAHSKPSEKDIYIEPAPLGCPPVDEPTPKLQIITVQNPINQKAILTHVPKPNTNMKVALKDKYSQFNISSNEAPSISHKKLCAPTLHEKSPSNRKISSPLSLPLSNSQLAGESHDTSSPIEDNCVGLDLTQKQPILITTSGDDRSVTSSSPQNCVINYDKSLDKSEEVSVEASNGSKQDTAQGDSGPFIPKVSKPSGNAIGKHHPSCAFHRQYIASQSSIEDADLTKSVPEGERNINEREGSISDTYLDHSQTLEDNTQDSKSISTQTSENQVPLQLPAYSLSVDDPNNFTWNASNKLASPSPTETNTSGNLPLIVCQYSVSSDGEDNLTSTDSYCSPTRSPNPDIQYISNLNLNPYVKIEGDLQTLDHSKLEVRDIRPGKNQAEIPVKRKRRRKRRFTVAKINKTKLAKDLAKPKRKINRKSSTENIPKQIEGIERPKRTASQSNKECSCIMCNNFEKPKKKKQLQIMKEGSLAKKRVYQVTKEVNQDALTENENKAKMQCKDNLNRKDHSEVDGEQAYALKRQRIKANQMDVNDTTEMIGVHNSCRDESHISLEQKSANQVEISATSDLNLEESFRIVIKGQSFQTEQEIKELSKSGTVEMPAEPSMLEKNELSFINDNLKHGIDSIDAVEGTDGLLQKGNNVDNDGSDNPGKVVKNHSLQACDESIPSVQIINNDTKVHAEHGHFNDHEIHTDMEDVHNATRSSKTKSKPQLQSNQTVPNFIESQSVKPSLPEQKLTEVSESGKDVDMPPETSLPEQNQSSRVIAIPEHILNSKHVGAVTDSFSGRSDPPVLSDGDCNRIPEMIEDLPLNSTAMTDITENLNEHSQLNNNSDERCTELVDVCDATGSMEPKSQSQLQPILTPENAMDIQEKSTEVSESGDDYDMSAEASLLSANESSPVTCIAEHTLNTSNASGAKHSFLEKSVGNNREQVVQNQSSDSYDGIPLGHQTMANLNEQSQCNMKSDEKHIDLEDVCDVEGARESKFNSTLRPKQTKPNAFLGEALEVFLPEEKTSEYNVGMSAVPSLFEQSESNHVSCDSEHILNLKTVNEEKDDSLLEDSSAHGTTSNGNSEIDIENQSSEMFANNSPNNQMISNDNKVLDEHDQLNVNSNRQNIDPENQCEIDMSEHKNGNDQKSGLEKPLNVESSTLKDGSQSMNDSVVYKKKSVDGNKDPTELDIPVVEITDIQNPAEGKEFPKGAEHPMICCLGDASERSHNEIQSTPLVDEIYEESLQRIQGVVHDTIQAACKIHSSEKNSDDDLTHIDSNDEFKNGHEKGTSENTSDDNFSIPDMGIITHSMKPSVSILLGHKTQDISSGKLNDKNLGSIDANVTHLNGSLTINKSNVSDIPSTSGINQEVILCNRSPDESKTCISMLDDSKDTFIENKETAETSVTLPNENVQALPEIKMILQFITSDAEDSSSDESDSDPIQNDGALASSEQSSKITTEKEFVNSEPSTPAGSTPVVAECITEDISSSQQMPEDCEYDPIQNDGVFTSPEQSGRNTMKEEYVNPELSSSEGSTPVVPECITECITENISSSQQMTDDCEYDPIQSDGVLARPEQSSSMMLEKECLNSELASAEGSTPVVTKCLTEDISMGKDSWQQMPDDFGYDPIQNDGVLASPEQSSGNTREEECANSEQSSVQGSTPIIDKCITEDNSMKKDSGQQMPYDPIQNESVLASPVQNGKNTMEEVCINSEQSSVEGSTPGLTECRTEDISIEKDSGQQMSYDCEYDPIQNDSVLKPEQSTSSTLVEECVNSVQVSVEVSTPVVAECISEDITSSQQMPDDCEYDPTQNDGVLGCPEQNSKSTIEEECVISELSSSEGSTQVVTECKNEDISLDKDSGQQMPDTTMVITEVESALHAADIQSDSLSTLVFDKLPNEDITTSLGTESHVMDTVNVMKSTSVPDREEISQKPRQSQVNGIGTFGPIKKRKRKVKKNKQSVKKGKAKLLNIPSSASTETDQIKNQLVALEAQSEQEQLPLAPCAGITKSCSVLLKRLSADTISSWASTPSKRQRTDTILISQSDDTEIGLLPPLEMLSFEGETDIKKEIIENDPILENRMNIKESTTQEKSYDFTASKKKSVFKPSTARNKRKKGRQKKQNNHSSARKELEEEVDKRSDNVTTTMFEIECEKEKEDLGENTEKFQTSTKDNISNSKSDSFKNISTPTLEEANSMVTEKRTLKEDMENELQYKFEQQNIHDASDSLTVVDKLNQQIVLYSEVPKYDDVSEVVDEVAFDDELEERSQCTKSLEVNTSTEALVTERMTLNPTVQTPDIDDIFGTDIEDDLEDTIKFKIPLKTYEVKPTHRQTVAYKSGTTQDDAVILDDDIVELPTKTYMQSRVNAEESILEILQREVRENRIVSTTCGSTTLSNRARFSIYSNNESNDTMPRPRSLTPNQTRRAERSIWGSLVNEFGSLKDK